MGKTINGFMLIDAPWSALNNAGIDRTEATEEHVKVKTIEVLKGRHSFTYPYVSAQAVRYWWRGTLSEKCRWKISRCIINLAFFKLNYPVLKICWI